MAFEPTVREQVQTYVSAHIADAAWHEQQFDFIDNAHLAKRIAEEFMAARYVYKMLEGLGATDFLLRAQIRIQILMYASIYEATLHHLLFSVLNDLPEVKGLSEYNKLKKISIPAASQAALERHLRHDGKEIIPCYQGVDRNDETKVRFDAKATCAAELGIISEALSTELIEFYEARNAIHIHAEIRKDLEYQIELSKRAYLRMEPFRKQIRAFLEARKHNASAA